MESSGGIADYADRRGDSDIKSGFGGALGDAAFGDWVVDLLELKEVSSHLEGVDFVGNRTSGNDKGVFENCSCVEDIDTNVSLIKPVRLRSVSNASMGRSVARQCPR